MPWKHQVLIPAAPERATQLLAELPKPLLPSADFGACRDSGSPHAITSVANLKSAVADQALSVFS